MHPLRCWSSLHATQVVFLSRTYVLFSKLAHVLTDGYVDDNVEAWWKGECSEEHQG